MGATSDFFKLMSELETELSRYGMELDMDDYLELEKLMKEVSVFNIYRLIKEENIKMLILFKYMIIKSFKEQNIKLDRETRDLLVEINKVIQNYLKPSPIELWLNKLLNNGGK